MQQQTAKLLLVSLTIIAIILGVLYVLVGGAVLATLTGVAVLLTSHSAAFMAGHRVTLELVRSSQEIAKEKETVWARHDADKTTALAQLAREMVRSNSSQQRGAATQIEGVAQVQPEFPMLPAASSSPGYTLSGFDD